MVHCSGAAARSAAWRCIKQSSLRVPFRTADVGALYDGFDAVGLQYGPGYRTLVQAWGDGASHALARLRIRWAQEGTQVHPADLDDALCTSGALTSGGGGETRLPFAVDDALLQGVQSELWAVRSLHVASNRPALLTTLAC